MQILFLLVIVWRQSEFAFFGALTSVDALFYLEAFMKKFLISILSILIGLFCAIGLTACTKEVNFSINFIVDGKVYDIVSTSGEEVISLPETPQKDGYIFDAWYWDENTWQRPFTANSLLNEPLKNDMNVYAKFIKDDDIKGTDIKLLNFELQQDELLGDIFYISLPNNTVIFSLIDKVEINNKSSWALTSDISGNNIVISKTIEPVIGDNFYYILVEDEFENVKQYILKIRRRPIYNVTFNSNGGDIIEAQQVEEGYKVEKTITPTKLGHYFNGWNWNYNDCVFSDIVIEAKWIENKITYNLNNGINNSANPILYNSNEVTLLKEPTRQGYSFIGWTLSSEQTPIKNFEIPTMLYGEIFITAHWEANPYTISFNTNNADYELDNEIYIFDEEFNLPKPETAGYDFIGWYYRGYKIEDGIWNIASNCELTAKWQTIPYKLTYFLNGGSFSQNEITSYTIEDQISLLKPTKEGYSFIGWSGTDIIDIKENVVIEAGSIGNREFEAHWEANLNTLYFNANSGLGNMSEIQVHTDESVQLPQNEFFKEGYSFEGWSISPNGNNVYYDGADYIMGKEAINTLYAVWKANINEIIFNANGGQGEMPSQKIATDETSAINENTFTKEGCSFVGWSLSSTGERKYINKANYTMGVEAQNVLYAVWAPYVRDGNYIYWGEYPQTLKENNIVITDTVDSRGFYLGNDGSYYAKVVSKPYQNNYCFSNGNIVNAGKTSYFKVEPIKWQIIHNSNGVAQIIPVSIIDCHVFDETSSNIYYYKSGIRNWLNGEFKNLVFSDNDLLYINTTKITAYYSESFGNNTVEGYKTNEDKIFLLSRDDIKNSWAKKTVTDYAIANGAIVSDNFGRWLLRTYYFYGNKIPYVEETGSIEYAYSASSKYFGIIPAMNIII